MCKDSKTALISAGIKEKIFYVRWVVAKSLQNLPHRVNVEEVGKTIDVAGSCQKLTKVAIS